MNTIATTQFNFKVDLSVPLCRSRDGFVRVTVSDDFDVVENDWRPLDLETSNLQPSGLRHRIFQSVLDLDGAEYEYGIVPGDYHFEDGVFVFEVNLTKQPGAILMYTDAPVKSACTKGLLNFSAKIDHFNAVVIPINYILKKIYVGMTYEQFMKELQKNL